MSVLPVILAQTGDRVRTATRHDRECLTCQPLLLLRCSRCDGSADGISWTTRISLAQHLLSAADCYGLDRLRLMCEELLCDNINIETAPDTLVLADLHQAIHLKKICLDFIAQNLSEAVKTDSFTNMTQCYQGLSAEVLQAAAGLIASEKAHEGCDGADIDGRRVRRRLNR